MAGNLTTAVATQQALSDPDREDRYIGLISGDYLMVPQKYTDELAKDLPNLDLVQGYLVRKDADSNVPLETRAQSALPTVTYATMRVAIKAMDSSCPAKATASSENTASSSGKKDKGKAGSKPNDSEKTVPSDQKND